MTRTNALPKIAETRNSLAWGKRFANGAMGNIHAYVFAAVLIICSVAVGCSSDKPKPVTSDNQIPTSQPQTALATPAPAMPAESKPAPKKIVHKKPATVNYADKTYGVTFEYPRRYAIETGDAATQLLASNPLPMNFVQPGGVALAAVELPETNYANTDFSSAFFNVSVNKAVSADQCGQFAVRQPKSEVKTEVATEVNAEAKSEVKTDSQTEVKPEATSAPASAEVAKQDAPKPDSPTSAQPAPSTEPTNAAKSSAASSERPRELQAPYRRHGTPRHRSRLRRRRASERLQIFPRLPERSLLRVRAQRHHRRLGRWPGQARRPRQSLQPPRTNPGDREDLSRSRARSDRRNSSHSGLASPRAITK